MVVPEDVAPTPEEIIQEFQDMLAELDSAQYQETLLEEVDDEVVNDPDSTDVPAIDLA